MTNLEQTLLEANKRLYARLKNPLRSHGPDHHWRTYQNAVRLAKKMGVKYDAEVLAGAALFHDMSAYYPDEVGDRYHEFDHEKAEEVLSQIKEFPQDKLAAAVDAIKHHGSDPKYKRAGESIETTLLRDGDKLDVFGPIGVARIVMVRTLKGDTFSDILADFWMGGHLQRKWESISTKEAQEMGRADYEYSRKFFEELEKSVTAGEKISS